MNLCIRIATALLALVFCACVQAQGFPAKPVTMIVPYAPGGTGDIIGRALAQKLTAVLGQNMILDNRPGGA